MTATSDPGPDPLAALPLLREAGVSVYWEQLGGRTAWVADPDTRQVWISRSVPRGVVLRSLIEALQAIDEDDDPPVPPTPARLRPVPTAAVVEPGPDRVPPPLRLVAEPTSRAPRG